MGYENYGIDRPFVENIKLKMKNPFYKQRVEMILHGVTKADLQDRVKVSQYVVQCAKALGERLSDRMLENIIAFVIAEKIDPNNTFHLIKLWGMFR